MRDNVVDFAAAKRRRDTRTFLGSVREGRWSEEELDDSYEDSLIVERYGQWRGMEPAVTITDETHLWTADGLSKLDELMATMLSRQPIHWTTGKPERRAESDRVLRILRGTDHGSDDGDAEGHRDDPGVPRG